MGQQLGQFGLNEGAVPTGTQHTQIRGKLVEHLPAGAARPTVVLPPAGDGDGEEVLPAPLTDRF